MRGSRGKALGEVSWVGLGEPRSPGPWSTPSVHQSVCPSAAPKDNVGMLNIQSLVQGQVPLCFFIPCTFKLPPSLANEKASNLEGQWLRNLNDPPVASTNKRRPVQSRTANRFIMLGSLRAKNCSLMVRSVHRDDQAIYRFVVLKGQHMFHFDRKLHFQVSGEVTGTQSPRHPFPLTLHCLSLPPPLPLSLPLSSSYPLPLPLAPSLPLLSLLLSLLSSFLPFSSSLSSLPFSPSPPILSLLPSLPISIPLPLFTSLHFLSFSFPPSLSPSLFHPLPTEKQLPPSITLLHPLRAGVANNVTCSVPWVCTRQPPVISWLVPLPYKMGPQKTLSSSISVTPTWRNNPISLKCHVIIDGFKVSASKEAVLDLRCE